MFSEEGVPSSEEAGPYFGSISARWHGNIANNERNGSVQSIRIGYQRWEWAIQLVREQAQNIVFCSVNAAVIQYALATAFEYRRDKHRAEVA